MKKALIIFGIAVAGILIWRLLLSLGAIKSIPDEWLDYYWNYEKANELIEIPKTSPRCPLCNGRIVALYGGLGYKPRTECDWDGYSIWRFQGCVNGRGACWECTKCHKQFDKNGKAIAILNMKKEEYNNEYLEKINMIK